MRPILLSAALLLFRALPAAAQGLTIDSVAYTNDPERCEIAFTTATQNYYRVEFAAHPFTNNTGEVRTMMFGTGSAVAWGDTGSAAFTNGYYRVREIPRDAPLDLDGDGFNDVLELANIPCFDPLNARPEDSAGDCDSDGFSNAEELANGTDPTVPNIVSRRGLVINEVDYDQPGTDSAEFIEIYNNSTNDISLAGISVILVNGGVVPQAQYTAVSLAPAGTLPAGGYLVIAPPAMTITNTALVVRFSVASNNIQNGSPDGIALIDTVNNVLIDALSYEGSITSCNIPGYTGDSNLVEGTATPALEDAVNGYLVSLVRIGNGQDTNDASADWTTTTTLTPGHGNVITP